MADNEKLTIILSEIQGMKGDIQGMKGDIQGMKGDIQDMKGDIQDMKGDIKELKGRVGGIELHLENETDRNIQLLAENFIDLTNKLNQAIPAADKNLAYEVKVNYLIGKVNTLEKEVAELKVKTGVILDIK